MPEGRDNAQFDEKAGFFVSDSRDTTSANATSHRGGDGKVRQGDNAEKVGEGREGEVWEKCQDENGE